MGHRPFIQPTCIIDTCLPGTGVPVTFETGAPQDVARFRTTADLITALPGMKARLDRHPRGLLVGICPYPATPEAGGAPPLLLLFDEHQLHPAGGGPPAPGARFRLTRRFAPDWPQESYVAGVRKVLDYLVAGDAYQVNLALRFSAGYEGSPLLPFLELRKHFQPPYAAFIDLADFQILCFSPESFVEVSGSTVTTRPIKGTRPRSADRELDIGLATDLANHPKDRAENLMIVDLLRNDLGRVCLPGTVDVTELFAIRSYRNVHHLVSTVTGSLAPDKDLAALLKAVFPGGSITGAPKRRAMEIIAELEPHPRDIYCGSIFWVLPDGTFGSNIAIRTFLARDGVIHGWAGAGIVSDSDPDSEYRECLHKLQPLMAFLEKFI